MCGIVGIAGPRIAPARDLLERMSRTMVHRGPDDFGIWCSADHHVGLGQRRLAIIDLSPAGHQPMADETGDYWITFNGEIYNYQDLRSELEARGHRFRSATDTEVVLEAYRAWGVECLSRLVGMFAFGLYDTKARRLLLARDRVGEKPLFFRHTADRLVFASELKALMADPAFRRQLDVSALDHYLAYGYVPAGGCIFRDVRKLPAAHALLYNVETGRLREWRYWQLPPPPAAPHASVDELMVELEGLLENSVRRCLIADVPVGILLSGGIDSGLVTAMAARVSSRPVHTFTVSFPGAGSFDEGPYARRVAEHFGTRHSELIAEPATVALLPMLARQYDEPIADSSMVPTYLVSRLVRQKATVALGGDGGDELFGGYPHYAWIERQQQVRGMIPRYLRQGVSRFAARFLPVGVRGRNHLIGFASDVATSIAHLNLYFDAGTRRRLLAPVMDGREAPASGPEATRAALCIPAYSALRQATEADFRTTLVDGYLVKVDRASMLASLEVRAPWLDHRIVEFAFGRVPDDCRATAGELKILPRRLAQRLLPDGAARSRKQGFSLPLHRWFAGPWGRYMAEVLSECDPGLFDRNVVARLLEQQRRGLANMQRLFSLTIFELWRREYRVGFGSADLVAP